MIHDTRRLFTGFFQFSVLYRLLPHLVLTAIYAFAVTYMAPQLNIAGKALLDANSALFLGVILGLLLVFRTNSAYDRWWEGRRLWGQLVNDLRNLSIKFRELWRPDDEEREKLGRLMLEFAVSMKDHLREMDEKQMYGYVTPDANEQLAGGANAAPKARNRSPVVITRELYDFIGSGYERGRIDGFGFLLLDQHARSMMDILGACERIALSPITLAHKSLILHIISLYVGIVPWCLASSLGYWSVLFTVIGAYVVLGLEVVAEGKEQPFGTSVEDLPLDDICTTIIQSVKTILDVHHESTAQS